MTSRLGAVPLLVALALLGACGRQLPSLERSSPVQAIVAPEPATTTTTEAPVPTFTVARVKGSSIPVFGTPDAPAPGRFLSNPNEDGEPRLFLATATEPGWLEVMLPVRPNGSRGWIRESDVTLTQHQWRILVELGAHRITVWNGREIFLQEPVGVGKGRTPTPGGEYYVTELLHPPNPRGPYGPYAFGLSGFSEVLMSFNGGPGMLGIHGTNDPSGLGRDVSNGCIRMSNAGVTKLATTMPLGTPVTVVA